MTTSELIKILKAAGCRPVRSGASHEIWFSPISNKKFPVSRHKKEIPAGTANAILKQAGLK